MYSELWTTKRIWLNCRVVSMSRSAKSRPTSSGRRPPLVRAASLLSLTKLSASSLSLSLKRDGNLLEFVRQRPVAKIAIKMKEVGLQCFKIPTKLAIDDTIWTPETGLVTATMKVQRNALRQFYNLPGGHLDKMGYLFQWEENQFAWAQFFDRMQCLRQNAVSASRVRMLSLLRTYQPNDRWVSCQSKNDSCTVREKSWQLRAWCHISFAHVQFTKCVRTAQHLWKREPWSQKVRKNDRERDRQKQKEGENDGQKGK